MKAVDSTLSWHRLGVVIVVKVESDLHFEDGGQLSIYCRGVMAITLTRYS